MKLVSSALLPLSLSLALSALACSSLTAGIGDENVAATKEELTTVPPGPNQVEGIDVSHFQGAINWAAEKAQGRMFGVASVGDGLYQDPTFATNWSAMKAAGVIRGAYQYFEPAGDPIAQADILIAKVGKLGDGDLPATVDVEATGGQSAATIATKVGQWLARVEAGTGKKPMIYTGPYFWQSNVVSAAYGAYPLWIADYGVSRPQVPAGWSTFKIWQYSDSGGTLDVDRFEGTLAELQAFASSAAPTAPPKGTLDDAACATGIAGWAQAPTAPTKAIGVTLSFDGAAGAKNTEALALDASVARMDLCAPLGSCNHGFATPVPLGLMDSKAHQVFAYAKDAVGSAETLLANAPKSFTCAAPTPPVTPANGVKRLVPSAAVAVSWKVSMLTDVAHLDEPTIAAFPKGEDLPAAPDVQIADDGSPEVWLVENGKRRHVVSPASMTAWHFAATKKPAATLKAMPQGPDWRVTPFFVQGATPTLFALDVSPSTPPGPSGGPIAPASGDGAKGGAGDGPMGDAPAAGSGCALASATSTGRPGGANGTTLAAGAFAIALAARRRALRRGTRNSRRA